MTPTETIYVLDGSEFDHYRQRWDVEAPNERVQAALDHLLGDGFDGTACQMDNCSRDGGHQVGWRLHDGDEGQMAQTFHYVALVDDGETVHFACEDCHAALLPRKVSA